MAMHKELDVEEVKKHTDIAHRGKLYIKIPRM